MAQAVGGRGQNGLGIDDKLRSKNRRTVRYFLTDHLGSTVALTDTSGKIVSSTSYDSFGNATSNIATHYRYTGREYDADTGLYYYRNRWYDPELGRFISKDPIGFAGGDINLYGYVGNNPYGFIDPFGFWRCPPGGDPPSSWWDAIQGALDVVGLTPVVGLPADLLNAGISVARGNYGDAAFSMAAAVPVLGTAAGTSKIANRALKVQAAARARALGAAGEKAVGLKGAKETIKVNGRTRVPDEINRKLGTLTEVKNVKRQYFSSQLRDFQTYSQQKGWDFVLYTRSDTILSKPLQRAIDQKKIIHKHIKLK